MKDLDLKLINKELANKFPEEIIKWGLERGKSIISTHFGPYEAVLLHMITKIYPNIDVLWVDNGFATNATYRFAQKLTKSLNLNLHVYVPKYTSAFLLVRYGGIPDLDTKEHDEFTNFLKIEPFQRGLKDLAPKVWFTALRKEQSSLRNNLDKVSYAGENLLKISPILDFTKEDMENYLSKYNLPNELEYSDPTKGEYGRECGLHKSVF